MCTRHTHLRWSDAISVRWSDTDVDAVLRIVTAIVLSAGFATWVTG